MKYEPDNSVVLMDLGDLEHCGFDHADFDFELGTVGIDDSAARWPIALVVNFAGGYVATPGLDTDDLWAERKACFQRFRAMTERMLMPWTRIFPDDPTSWPPDDESMRILLIRRVIRGEPWRCSIESAGNVHGVAVKGALPSYADLRWQAIHFPTEEPDDE